MRTITGSLIAAFLASGTALAAPGDPYVVYTANREVDGAVVLRIDPAAGSLVEISRNGPSGTLFMRPVDIAVEADGNLLVADMGAPDLADGGVIRVDPVTGNQTPLSMGGQFFDPAGIAVAPGGDIYVVDHLAVDGNGGVFRVDPRTGAQTLVSKNGPQGSLFDLPYDVAIDQSGNLVVANRVSRSQLNNCTQAGSLIRVEPNTGVQTLISRSGTPFESLLAFPVGVAVEADGRLLVANECQLQGGVIRMNPADGDQSVVTANNLNDTLVTPERIALAPDGGLLVSDYNLGDGDGGVVAVNPVDGTQVLMRQGDLFNHPMGIATAVNRAPDAAIAVSPALVAAGAPVRFDGSGSTDPEGLRLSYGWDLDASGTFETLGGPSPVAGRSFSRHGSYQVRLRVSDPHGGMDVTETSVSVDGAPPLMTRLQASARVLGVGPAPRRARRPSLPRSTRVGFALSEAGTVTVALRRALWGRRVGGRCRRSAPRGRPCRLWGQGRKLSRQAAVGPNGVRLRSRGLEPGRYRVVAFATDAVGNRSDPRSLWLRVVRTRR